MIRLQKSRLHIYVDAYFVLGYVLSVAVMESIRILLSEVASTTNKT